MASLQSKQKLKKGYSLVEVLVSLAVIGVVLTLLFNTVVVAIRVTIKSMARSLVREEITTTVDLIAKDIKNSDYVNLSSSYTFVIDGKEYTWGICETKKVCKLDNTTPTSPVVLYKTSDNVEFTGLDLSYGFDNLSASGIYSKKNILITLVANHSNPVFNINNVFRQESISTRNYEL